MPEPLSIAFASTHHAVRGRPRDGIDSPDRLLDWLRANAERLGIDRADPRLADGIDASALARYRGLRDTVRRLAAALTEGEAPDPAWIAELNRASAAAPRWPVLDVDGTGFSIAERTRGHVTQTALAAIARDAIDLFGGPLRADLMACHAPGCVLFFVKDHPRREWCSTGCGNRARAARHYLRHRSEPAPS